MPHFTPLLGVAVILLLGVALSTARARIRWRLIASGVLLQFVIAYLLLRFDRVIGAFDLFAAGVARVISFADAGIVFLFGNLADASKPWGFVFAVKVLPVIVFFASLMGVLYHVGVMQRVVAGVAWVLRRAMGITGVEALSAAANIFVGQTEAPLTVRPYLATMTRSQLMAVMVGGFATIAGSVMAAYIGLLGGESEEGRILFAKHLMTASVMSAPAGLVMAKLMLPETDEPRPESVRALMHDQRTTSNVLDAAAAGATDGLRLAANVAAMLVAFVALLALVNWPLAALGDWAPVAAWRAERGIAPFTLQALLGYPLTPLAWLIGAEWKDAPGLGALMGTQIIATEFVAYIDLSAHIKAGTLSPRTGQIAAYCLCGFANIPSMAIQIGGLSALAPSRRADLVALAPRAMLAGALACWMTGAVAAVFIA